MAGQLSQQLLQMAQTAYKQHQAQLQQQRAQEQQQLADANQDLINALKGQLEQDITPELREFLQVEYITREFGQGTKKETRALTVLTLTNEHGSPFKGYIEAMLVGPNGQVVQPGYQVIMPTVNNKGGKDVYDDLSGGSNHYCYRAELNKLLLRLIGEWESQMQQLRQQIRQRQQQWEDQQRIQQSAREEKERIKAQQEAERAQRQVLSDQIKGLIDEVVMGLRTYPHDIWAGKTLTVYQFVVKTGTGNQGSCPQTGRTILTPIL